MSREISEQEDFYDERWRGVEYANRLKLIRCSIILRLLAMTQIDNPRMLEVGCGTGWLTAILGEYGPATGIELSPEAVEQATARYSHVSFEHVNLADWQPEAEVYDVVVSHEVIEHVEDQARHIQQVATMLRSGGFLILTTPNDDVTRHFSEERRQRMRTQPIENWLTYAKLKSLLTEQGLVEQHATTCLPRSFDRGVYRYVNAVGTRELCKRLGVVRLFDSMRESLGWGLHRVVLAKKVG